MQGLRAFVKASSQRLGLFEALRAWEISWNAHRGAIHEPEFRNIPSSVDGGVIADIGANLGQSITSLHRLFPRSPIQAFEPNPACLPSLERVKSLTPTPVTLNSVGIGAATSLLTFFVPVLSTGAELLQEGSYDPGAFLEEITIQRIGRPFDLKRMEIEVRCLDDYELDLSLIKIDVQGFELQVLQGAQDTIKRCRPAIFLERDLRNESAITSMLRDVGYESNVFSSNMLFTAAAG